MISCRMIRHTVVLLLIFSHSAYAEQAAGIEALSLEQAIKIAVEHNHDLRLSAIARSNAAAASVIAAAAPNPTLTVQNFSINPKAGIGTGTLRSKTVDSTLRIDQLIERGGKRELRMENSAHLEEAVRNDFHDALRQLRIGVGQAYYDVLAAQEKLEITRQTASLYNDTVTAAQKRLKAGDIASADVARLQVDALDAQNDVTQAAAEVFKARRALAVQLGQLAHAEKIKLTDSWPAARLSTATAPDAAIEQRADVRAAKSRLDAAISARKLARAARSRDVTIGVQYEHFPASDANPQGSGNSYGIALQIPLFTRYAFEGEIRAAEAAVDAARENLEKARDLALNELLNNWEEIRSASERLNRYDESLLPAAKKSADAAEFAFKHGALSIMDVLDIRRTYRATQLDALAVRADHAKSWVAWQASTSENITQ